MTKDGNKFTNLSECLQQGDCISFFPLLKDWPRERLNSLLGEMEQIEQIADDEWGKLALLAENFLSKQRSQILDQSRFELMCILSEITAVALYYIGKSEERESGVAKQEER